MWFKKKLALLFEIKEFKDFQISQIIGRLHRQTSFQQIFRLKKKDHLIQDPIYTKKSINSCKAHQSALSSTIFLIICQLLHTKFFFWRMLRTIIVGDIWWYIRQNCNYTLTSIEPGPLTAKLFGSQTSLFQEKLLHLSRKKMKKKKKKRERMFQVHLHNSIPRYWYSFRS